MSKKNRVSFIGGGNMATAIIDGILKAQLLSENDISLFDLSEEKKSFFANKGLNIANSNADVACKGEILFLAVKPQNIDSVLTEIKDCINSKCIVSIAAGISTTHIRKIIEKDIPIIRVLPNTPMLVLEGMTVIAENNAVSKDILDFVFSIFRATGDVIILPESMINEAIPMSSSSPAFFFRMLNAMAKAGEKSGLTYSDSFKLAAVAMKGSAEYALKSDKTPEELIRQVSSPGGTTVAALTAFDEMNFEELIDKASKRCVDRAYQLGKEAE